MSRIIKNVTLRDVNVDLRPVVKFSGTVQFIMKITLWEFSNLKKSLLIKFKEATINYKLTLFINNKKLVRSKNLPKSRKSISNPFSSEKMKILSIPSTKFFQRVRKKAKKMAKVSCN